MIVEAADRATRPVWPAPIGTELETPPLRPVTQIDVLPRWRENQRASLEHMRQRARIVLRIGPRLCECDVTCCVDEFAKLTIGDRRPVHPKATHVDTMRRCLLGIMLVGAHAERPARNPDHIRTAGFIRQGYA